MEALDRLEESIKKLRTAYEKYFAGVERIAPGKDRDNLKKDLRRLLGQRINNTAWRFRLQGLQASLITHEVYWNRITRQIEEGTYHRDLKRAQRKAAESPPATEPTREEAASSPDLPPAPRAGAAAAAAAKPAAAAKKGAADSHPAYMEKLHAAYNQARKQAGADKNVSIDSLARTVKKQTAALKEKYKCKTVEFRVAVKDGKAILKAVPKQ